MWMWISHHPMSPWISLIKGAKQARGQGVGGAKGNKGSWVVVTRWNREVREVGTLKSPPKRKRNKTQHNATYLGTYLGYLPRILL